MSEVNRFDSGVANRQDIFTCLQVYFARSAQNPKTGLIEEPVPDVCWCISAGPKDTRQSSCNPCQQEGKCLGGFSLNSVRLEGHTPPTVFLVATPTHKVGVAPSRMWCFSASFYHFLSYCILGGDGPQGTGEQC